MGNFGLRYSALTKQTILVRNGRVKGFIIIAVASATVTQFRV